MIGAVGFPQVDASRLRDTLDAVRRLVSHSPLGSIHAPLISIDQPPIAATLRAVLSALDARPDFGRIAEGDTVATLFAREGMASIVTLLETLPDVWQQRVATTLGAKKIAVLRDLCALRVPDFLGIVGKSTHENNNSNVLRWLLDPQMAPTVAPAALASLTSRLDDSPAWRYRIGAALDTHSLSVRREYTIGREWTGGDERERIDLVVSGPDFVLAIENKIMARERGEQTRHYWEWLRRLPARFLRAGIFLSPAGLPAAAVEFASVSYLELLNALLEAPTQSPLAPEEQAVLASYVATLATGILRVELRLIRREGGYLQ